MLDLVKKLLEQTQQMKLMLETEDWEKAEYIQKQRLITLARLRENQIEELPEDTARDVAQLLQAIKRLEHICEQLATAQRNLLTKEQGKVSKGKAMQRAYGAHRNKF